MKKYILFLVFFAGCSLFQPEKIIVTPEPGTEFVMKDWLEKNKLDEADVKSVETDSAGNIIITLIPAAQEATVDAVDAGLSNASKGGIGLAIAAALAGGATLIRRMTRKVPKKEIPT